MLIPPVAGFSAPGADCRGKVSIKALFWGTTREVSVWLLGGKMFIRRTLQQGQPEQPEARTFEQRLHGAISRRATGATAR
jgi:hypothetical protein